MSGLGSTNYTVAANSTGAPRTGTMTIAGQTVTVTQAAASCSYSASPTTISAPSTGTSGSVAVTTGSSCPWTATSAVSWITITSPTSLSGVGSVDYTVARNATAATRTGVLTIAGRTVTLTQTAGDAPAAPTGFRIVQ
jgi:phage baseplate assembly protein gpV